MNVCVLIHFTPSFRVFQIVFVAAIFGDSLHFSKLLSFIGEKVKNSNNKQTKLLPFVAPNGRKKRISEKKKIWIRLAVLNKRSPCFARFSLTHSTDSAQVQFLSTWWSPTLVLLWFFSWPLPRFQPSLKKFGFSACWLDPIFFFFAEL